MGSYKILHRTVAKYGKEKNEDRLMILEASFYNDITTKVFMVADGIGSLKRSDEAAQRAVDGAADRIFIELRRLYVGKKEKNMEDISYIQRLEDILRKAFCEANHRVCELGIGAEAGATLSVVLVFGEYAVCANLGDSPIYYYDGTTMKLVSELHVEKARNVLTKSLGETKKFDSRQVYVNHIGHLKEKDFILAGSDGAFGKLSEEEILRVVKESSTIDLLKNLFDNAENCDDQSAVFYEILQEE